MTKQSILPLPLRLNLDMVAAKHGVQTKGKSVGQIIVDVCTNSELSDSERDTFKKILKHAGVDESLLHDIESRQAMEKEKVKRK